MDIRLSSVLVLLPGTETILFRVRSLEIRQGSRILLQAPSGKGKTTFLHLIAGLFQPEEGYVFVGENNLRFLSDEQRCRLRREHFGMIFQKLNLIDHLTAEENVLLALPARAHGSGRAKESLERLGIGALAGSRTANLSLGEQQRVAVARVLAARPRIVLADEPTSSLDDANAGAVIDALLTLPGDPTLVVVSHDHRIRSRFERCIDFEELISR
jgi:putative ABC transport system ATP-binding protein